MFTHKIVTVLLIALYALTGTLQAEEYDKTSYYVAYDKDDSKQFVLVMPSIQKAYTHEAGHIASSDLKRVDDQFVSFPTYNDGNLCFSALKSDATGANGADKMEEKCYEVNFFYTQKEVIAEGVAFILFYAPSDKVYEGLAGDAESFDVVREGSVVHNENSITGDDYTNFAFNVKTGVVEGVVEVTMRTYINLTTAMLYGKTFYEMFIEDGEGDNGTCYASMIFTVTEGRRHQICNHSNGTLRSDEEFTFSYEIVDGKMRVDAEDEYKWFTLNFKDATAWHMINDDDDGKDGTLDSTGERNTWYLEIPASFPVTFENKADAVDSFTTAWLNGKTLYWVVYDDFGYDDVGEKWNMARFTFHEESVDFQEYNTQDSDVHNFSYSVTKDGKLIFDGTNHFTIVSSTVDYLYIQDGDGEYQYLFFDENKADTYLKSLEITTSKIEGKVFYTVNDRGDGSFDFEKYNFVSATEMEYTEILLESNGNIQSPDAVIVSYSVSNGNLNIAFDFGAVTYALQSQESTQWTMLLPDSSSGLTSAWLLVKPNNYPDKASLSNEITTGLLATNPWYRIEYTDTETYCNGKFSFDEEYNLNVSWLENSVEETSTGTYSIEEKLLVTNHDGKVEKEELISQSISSFTVEKKAYDASTDELKHTMNVKYFQNYSDAIAFGNDRGVDCSSDIPE